MTYTNKLAWSQFFAGDKVKDVKVRNRKVKNSNYKNDAMKTQDTMAKYLDQKDSILKYKDLIERMEEGKMGIAQALDKLSPSMLLKILELTLNGSDKVKLEAAKDLLDRAGYTKVNKVALRGAIDTNASKEELISTILGMNDKTKAIEIVDDEEDKT